MSFQENSFHSETDTPMKPIQHSLCEDLEAVEINWGSRILDISKQDSESENENENSMSSLSDNYKLQREVQAEQANKTTETSGQKSFTNQQQEIESQESTRPKTTTLIDQPLSSKHQNQAIPLNFIRYNTKVDNQSFATFLNIQETNYNSIIKNFQLLFENVWNIFGQRLRNMSSTYLSLIRKAYIKEKTYLSVITSHINENLNHMQYSKCKFILGQIQNKLQNQRNKHEAYVKSLEKINNELEKHFQQVNSIVKDKRNKIIKIYQSLASISNQMTDLMIIGRHKMKKKDISHQLLSNSYIRTKHLMGQEKLYLCLVRKYLQKIMNFISYICLEMEPKNNLIVKQFLLIYTQAFKNFMQQNSQNLQAKIGILSKINCPSQIYKQITKLLVSCIPESIPSYSFSSRNSEKSSHEKELKRVIQYLIRQSQSLVYIPVIQLGNRDFAYHSKSKANVKWMKTNHDRKKQQNQEQFQVYVIITHEGHLVLELLGEKNEKDEKMMIIKLNQIKITQKGYKIFLTDHKKGVIGYLVSTNAVLGTLTFQPLNQTNNENKVKESTVVQQFLQRVATVLKENKQKKSIKSSKY